ncbi:MAG TPA: SDR family NAD(P)-dependent oxidoreductase [Thermodesulfobacteriota bacterium]|nr:SDR family NAD(P)-dependent oxidoreductase [Thermodesulfobacteriota bacterium]
MRFKDKVAIVTGGASGIGAATARALAREGARVAVMDMNPEGLRKIESEFTKEGFPFLGVAGDVSREEAVKSAIDQTVSRFGGIDLLVNNAGISPKHNGKKANLWEMPIAEWDKVMAVNIRGMFLCCHYAVPRMIERKGGAIVNTSSLAAKVGSAVTACHYVISKAGVVGLTKSLAREVADYGIRVNAVAPGRIDTPMIWDVPKEVNDQYMRTIPLKRLGKPEDVSDGILFLLSEAASYITGLVLDVNGGLGMYY